MIPKNELRIGNLVDVDGHRESFIEVLQLKSRIAVVKGISTFQIEYEMLFPILVTQQLLDKYDFKGNIWKERKANDYLTLSVRIPDKNKGCALMLTSEILKGSITAEGANFIAENNLPKEDAEIILSKKNYVILPPVQFLHQLQNKYFELSGKELF